MVFYLALLPNLVDLGQGRARRLSPSSCLVTQIVLATVFAGYIVLASRARRLFRSPPRACASSIAATGADDGRRGGGGRNTLKQRIKH